MQQSTNFTVLNNIITTVKLSGFCLYSCRICEIYAGQASLLKQRPHLQGFQLSVFGNTLKSR